MVLEYVLSSFRVLFFTLYRKTNTFIGKCISRYLTIKIEKLYRGKREITWKK